jgi:hypothetical protein
MGVLSLIEAELLSELDELASKSLERLL